MTTFEDLRTFFQEQKFDTIIIVADGQTRNHKNVNGDLVSQLHVSGVSVAFDAIARAGNVIYIARGKSEDDRKVLDAQGKVRITSPEGDYTLKRLFFNEEETDNYYYGFANQTMWPLCHVAFERPIFRQEWYDGYLKVCRKYAKAIKEEIRGKTFVWINDYQLPMVPKYLGKQKDVTVGYFWHIPWPTWEIFRILPYKKDILWSLLSCDYLAFHREYQARNFLDTVARELEARIDMDRKNVYFDENVLRVDSLPMGIDTDILKSLVTPKEKPSYLVDMVKQALNIPDDKQADKKEKKKDSYSKYFTDYKVIVGTDRLDYTKGLPYRLWAIDEFFMNHPEYLGKVIYLGIMSPSREKIPSYQALKKQIETIVTSINRKYATKEWKPLHMIYESFSREDVVNLFNKASVCLVTPLDDGMNLVSKEFIIASSMSSDPGMLILSQFAGSAIDLGESLIVNPYDTGEVAAAIARALAMKPQEKRERLKHMVSLLDEHNIYEWARSFIRNATNATRENRRSS